MTGDRRVRTWSRFQVIGLALLLLFIASSAEAAKWSRPYITSLEDSAFAAIETTPEGKKIRHLPHHDHTGKLDVPHLLSALGRIDQVKWLDPRNRATAERHLKDHLNEYRRALPDKSKTQSAQPEPRLER
ncbi:MAG: hypothetical protein HY278_05625 [candidate division NC10 bacterium]|nr:hypothetical protein [candidate division NC10 bacterium]